MQISAAIGSATNYKSRITIPDVLFDHNYITSASLTPPFRLCLAAISTMLEKNSRLAKKRAKKIKEYDDPIGHAPQSLLWKSRPWLNIVRIVLPMRSNGDDARAPYNPIGGLCRSASQL